MKKDKVLIYNGGFIDYDPWNAPVIIDITGMQFEKDEVPIMYLGEHPVGRAHPWRHYDDREGEHLDADINFIQPGGSDVITDPTFAFDIIVDDGKYIEPDNSIEINNQRFTTHNNGAWVITKSRLQAITATSNGKPCWKIDKENMEAGAAEMVETHDDMEATFTNAECEDFAVNQKPLTVPLVYMDKAGTHHSAGEITVIQVPCGKNDNAAMLFETYCWPAQLADVEDKDIEMTLVAVDRERTQAFYDIVFQNVGDVRHVGFLPFKLMFHTPLNVVVSRKDNASENDDKSKAEVCNPIWLPMFYLPEHSIGNASITHIPVGDFDEHRTLIVTEPLIQGFCGINSDRLEMMVTCDNGLRGKIDVKCNIITAGERILAVCSDIHKMKAESVTIVRQPEQKHPEPTELQDTAHNTVQDKIAQICDAIKNLLLEKNRKYGNSALNPVRVFSKADTVEQIKVRMDDKLSRIRNEQSDEDEDVYMDLAGYLVLMLIAKKELKQQEKNK